MAEGQYPILEYGFIGKLRVHFLLAMVQVGYAGFQIITKLAFQDGLNKTTYPIYRNIIGFSIILPFAAYYERNDRPNLTFTHVVHFFLLGLTAVAFGQGLFLYGLDDTSPTFASAFQNSIPAMTFIMAAVSKVEDVNIKRRDGQAKLFGAISAGVGATLMTAYKGPLILKNAVSSHTTYYNNYNNHHQHLLDFFNLSPWHLGSLCLLISCVSFGAFYVLQARTLKMYPAGLSTVCFTNSLGAIQLALFAVVSQPTISIWRVSPGIQLLSVLYAGLIASGLVFSAQAWCMQKAGPVIVSTYQPLQTVVVGIISHFFLGESFYLGSVIGAILILGGLYMVTYGQEKQKEHVSRQNSLQNEPNKMEEGLNQPLLD